MAREAKDLIERVATGDCGTLVQCSFYFRHYLVRQRQLQIERRGVAIVERGWDAAGPVLRPIDEVPPRQAA